MTKYISKITALFSITALLALTSCSDDDNNTPVPAPALQVTLTEVGHGGTPPHAHAGEDLHLEAEILAHAKIAGVIVTIHSESNNGAPEITQAYNDYNGLINAEFHKHIDIPASHPAGLYHLHLTVTDMNGNSVSAESELEILAAGQGGEINIALTEIGHGAIGSSHAHAGEELHVGGTITSAHAVTTINVEIHNESDPLVPAIEAEFINYAGQTNINFHEHILIPASQPAGHYHFHITVTDDEGNSKTAEYELEIE